MDFSDLLFPLELLFRMLLGPLFFGVGCVPFIVWAAQVTRASTAASESGYPGHTVSFWFAVLPVSFFIYILFRGLDVHDPAKPYAEDEWGQILGLLTVPASGWLFGFGLGQILGNSERERV